ncbi:hypothetical protein D3C81_1841470 [compost metagenome]
MPSCSQLPASKCALSTPRSSKANSRPTRLGSKGAKPWLAITGSDSPAVTRIAASISSKGTDVATRKISHSWLKLSRLYWFCGSMLTCCSPLSTSTAARATISGQSACNSSRCSGLTAW